MRGFSRISSTCLKSTRYEILLCELVHINAVIGNFYVLI